MTPLLLAAGPVLLVAGLFLFPYARNILRALPALGPLLASGRANGVLGYTLAQAALSTLLSLALGVPAAWILSATRGPLRAAGRALGAIPFALPPILLVLGFVLFFGNAGHLNRLLALVLGRDSGPLQILYNRGTVVLAHAFYNFPLVLLLVGDRFTRIRESLAARVWSLGARPASAFFTVFFPLALPAILAAGLLVFLYCATSFAVVLVLGGGPGATTLAVEIYRNAKITLDGDRAAALASLEIAISLFAYLLYARADRLSARAALSLPRSEEGLAPPKKTGLANMLFISMLSLFILGPLVSIPLESLLARKGRAGDLFVSLKWWQEGVSGFLPAAVRSLLLALTASLASLAIAIPAAGVTWLSGSRSRLSRLVSFTCLLPIISSGIVLSQAWLDIFGARRSSPLILIALLQALGALPFAFRAIQGSLASQGDGLRAQALSLGAHPLAAFLTVGLPAAGAGIRSAFAFSMAICLGELGIVLMLADDAFVTLPVWIYRATSSYRFGSACAAGSLLMALCALAFVFSQYQPKEAPPVPRT